VDSGDYRATQAPKRGKIVNPSGERADRPQFLKMLVLVKTGEIDVVLCWRSTHRELVVLAEWHRQRAQSYR
jgi:DNA invertase Pin-like site-specific DNA recombinase